MKLLSSRTLTPKECLKNVKTFYEIDKRRTQRDGARLRYAQLSQE